jgi:hypothetical protein
MRKWIAANFYDPLFAAATAFLSLMLMPLWWLMVGIENLSVALWVTAIFTGGVLIFMLYQSYVMAKEDRT